MARYKTVNLDSSWNCVSGVRPHQANGARNFASICESARERIYFYFSFSLSKWFAVFTKARRTEQKKNITIASGDRYGRNKTRWGKEIVNRSRIDQPECNSTISLGASRADNKVMCCFFVKLGASFVNN